MPSVERLFERRLRRPLDAAARAAIDAEAIRRRPEIPIPAEFSWHPTEPVFTIRSPLMSFVVSFASDTMVVDATMSLAGRLLATAANRRQAVRLIESIADDLDL